MKINDIAKECGLSRTTVIAVCKAYERGDWAGVKLKKRGRPIHSGRLLSSSQEAEIMKTMLKQTPDQLAMPSCLWSSSIVSQFITGFSGQRLSDRVVRNYLNRWGVTAGRVSNANSWVRHRQRFKTEYADLETKAYSEGYSVYFLYAVRLKTSAEVNPSIGDEQSLTDLTPDTKPSKEWVLLRSLSSQGRQRWNFYPGRLTTSVLKDFCERLCQDVPGKIMLLLAPSKQSKSVRMQIWLSRRKDKLLFVHMPELDAEKMGSYLKRLPA